MGGGPQEPTGPELREEGVALAALREGEPLLGHADGEGIVLVRAGDEVHAVGASCTHYGGPLAEGLVTGDVIRCPWHHACFSLRTGEAVAAPALNPLVRWRTTVRDGVVTVTERIESGPLDAHGRQAAAAEPMVIVGAGAAGSAAAEMLRREGYEGRIVLIDPDAAAPYDRPNLSKDYLAGDAPEEWIPLRPPGFHAEHGIERIDAAVERIDTASRRIDLADGRSFAWGALLLATGAEPIRLRIPGADRPHVHVLRSLDDSRALIAAAGEGARIVIAGASFIGMEAAASLRARGAAVTVVAPEAVPFERTLGEALGGLLRDAHEAAGVGFRLGRTVASIGEDAVELDDGERLPADAVLLGVGVRPRVALAEAAGLDVDGGVLVDAYLRTSADGVFAAGDIARYPDATTGERVRIEHWVVAQRQGQTAAKNMLGCRVRFEAAPFFWTVQHGVGVSYVGHAAEWQRTDVDGDVAARDCRVDYVAGGEVRAVATVGRDGESLRAEQRLEAGVPGAG